ncbi:Protein tweety 3 [Willisornis vidua]|uniref:Protein tweety homolog n=1 Tax=Willisornis vidua TaxID=1566151 RepID=A0ABQ9CQ08_9PASS|nr:Protein tweety 3 [Willisornis vidua]
MGELGKCGCRQRHIFGCNQAFSASQSLGPKLTHQSERLITALLDDFTCCHGTYPLMENKYSLENEMQIEALLLLGGIALSCLALDLLFLLFYSFWLCCRHRKSEEHLNADCCCTAWCVIIATLVCSAGIAVGFYGNGETSDGIHRVTYSLRHANRTVAGVQDRNEDVSLEELAIQIDLYDWYRWLGYLGLLLFHVLICLLVLFGLIRNSRAILMGVCLLGVFALIVSWGSLGLELAVAVGSSDFCINPDAYISKLVEENAVLSADILRYYMTCSAGYPNPFQQKLSGSHKALVEMQDDVTELMRSASREHPNSKEYLTRIQDVLNSTEINLQQLTALVDCRSLHLDYVQALTGFCYDGVEGLIYLVLFSFVTALMFSSIVCSVPHTWQQKRGSDDDGEEESAAQGSRQTHDNLYRVHMPSLYSCGSSYGSETSIPAAAHTVSNAPVTEYMSQNANFQNPRCENTPLIGRESPPPSWARQIMPPGVELPFSRFFASSTDYFMWFSLKGGGNPSLHCEGGQNGAECWPVSWKENPEREDSDRSDHVGMLELCAWKSGGFVAEAVTRMLLLTPCLRPSMDQLGVSQH